MQQLDDVVIVDFLRTPMSKSSPQAPEKDVFYKIRADELLGMVTKEILKRNSFDPKNIDDFITGCAFPVCENWLYGGRHAVFTSELPITVPAMAIDRQCGSSMSALHIGAMEIMTGNAQAVLIGGMEHMTRVPMDLVKNPGVKINEKLFDHAKYPEYTQYELEIGFSMIQTAQNLHEQTGITREEMDTWSKGSHDKAAAAIDEGYFNGEILPITVELPDGTQKVVSSDQSVRKNSDIEGMKKLPLVSKGLKKEAQITPGNASPLNAGAGCALIMSAKAANQWGLKPLAKIRSMAWAGVKPALMGTGPIPASRLALKRAGLQVDEIDFWEINEAFAVVAINACRELNIPPERINAKGGAIALGHALGLTGIRLVGTLARILKAHNKKLGLATPCIGGGQGTATIIERV
jgi:acetyl-CoA C-acetyltransferase